MRSIAVTTNAPNRTSPQRQLLLQLRTSSLRRAQELIEDSIGFDEYTEPMKRVIRDVAAGRTAPILFRPPIRGWWMASRRRIRVISSSATTCCARVTVTVREMATRQLQRRIPLDQPLFTPVNDVLPGRRNNPPDPAARHPPAAVFNPSTTCSFRSSSWRSSAP